MKVLLIRPPILQLCSNFSYSGVILPIGLAYIAAALRNRGHEVLVIDAVGEALERFGEMPGPAGIMVRRGLSPDEIVARIPRDVCAIGMTHMFLHEWPIIREISQKIKTKYPTVPIILGGENATAFWRRIFEETNAIDYCVLGEGEETVLKLIGDIEHEITPFPQAGVVAFKAGMSQSAELPQRISDIGSLAWPAWDLFPVDHYLEIKDAHGVNRGPAMPLLATRGCPYDCTFCSSPLMWTPRYIVRRPTDVVAEIKCYVDRYGVSNINFCDLTAVVRKEWILEFCNIMLQQSFRITWQLPSGTRSEALDFEVLQKMYAAGCRNISYSPESGSERMLKILKKKVDLKTIAQSLRAARKSGLVTHISMIIGHPQEKKKDIWLSFCFVIHCALIGCDDISVLMFAPYPGSEDAKDLVRQGALLYDENYYYSSLARSGTSSKTYSSHMTTRALIFCQYFLVMAFYGIAYLSRPWRLFFLVRSLWTGIESTQVEQIIRIKLKKKNK